MRRPTAYALHKIPGLRPEDREDDWFYEWRNQWADYDATKVFYEEYPPEVGQTVVILQTYGQRMQKPDVKKIEVIHERGGIIVNHNHDDYAGTLFLRNGQNWKAKRSQTWLVPAELYKDIPKQNKDEDWSSFAGYPEEEGLTVGEMQDIVGVKRFKEGVDRLMHEQNLTWPKAKKLLELQILSEKRALGRGRVRAITREQNRFGRRLV